MLRLVSHYRFPAFPYSILVPTLNDIEEKGTADPIDKGLPFLRGVKKYKEYFIRKKKWTFPVGQYDNII